MNDERRKNIAKARDLLTEARVLIETARDEEQEYYDNMPESFQSGDKGEKASAAADALGEVASELEDFDGKLEEAAE